MKKNRQAIMICIFQLVCISVYNQTPQQNLNKYWNYRTEFFDKFIVDADPGNLPSYATPEGINLPADVVNVSDTIGTNEQTITFGSETPTSLGEYICAMASEYALQEVHGLDNSNPQEKIYRAMNAMNRLDTLAERIFAPNMNLGPNPCTDATNLNGFFLRTDMDEVFLDNWKPTKSSWSNLENLISPYYTHINDPEDGNQVSQDQVWNYLLGLAMVKGLVDDPATYEDYPCDYVTLEDMAKNQTSRMIKFMQSYVNGPQWWLLPKSDNDYPGRWNGSALEKIWRIKNPVTRDNVPAGGEILDLYQFKPHFEDAGNWITGENLNYTPTAVYWLWFLIPGLPIPTDIPFSIPAPGNHYNNIGKLVLSTISQTINANSVEELLFNTRKYVDHYNQELPGNPHELKNFFLDHLPMIQILLHNETPSSSIFYYYYSRIEYLLNEAPSDGPSNDEWPIPEEEFIWSTQSLWRKPIGHIIYKDPEDPNDGPDWRDDLLGEYAGLDYLILFNLYHLIYDKLFDDPVTVTNDFPTTYSYPNYNYNYGSEIFNIGRVDNVACYTIHSKDLITMNSTVSPTGKICLRGNEVLLLPGFEVHSFAEFTAETNDKMELDFTPPAGNYKSAQVNPKPIIIEDRRIEGVENPFETNSVDQLRIYPNPAKSVLSIESPSQISNITMYNSSGTIVNQICGEGYEVMRLDVSGHNPGIYFISITLEDGSVEVKKVIIE